MLARVEERERARLRICVCVCVCVCIICICGVRCWEAEIPRLDPIRQ
jgi:hypothetical protein